jgi:hypothetical protein
LVEAGDIIHESAQAAARAVAARERVYNALRASEGGGLLVELSPYLTCLHFQHELEPALQRYNECMHSETFWVTKMCDAVQLAVKDLHQ